MIPHPHTPLTRDQCIFVVWCILASAVDAIISLEHSIDRKAIIDTTGWNLSVFAAQVTNEGLGVGDALTMVGIEAILNLPDPSVVDLPALAARWWDAADINR